MSAGVQPAKPMDRSPAVAQPCRHGHLQALWPWWPVHCNCQPELGGTAHSPDTHPLLCHQPTGPESSIRASLYHGVSHPSWSHAATLLWVCSPNTQVLLTHLGAKQWHLQGLGKWLPSGCQSFRTPRPRARGHGRPGCDYIGCEPGAVHEFPRLRSKEKCQGQHPADELGGGGEMPQAPQTPSPSTCACRAAAHCWVNLIPSSTAIKQNAVPSAPSPRCSRDAQISLNLLFNCVHCFLLKLLTRNMCLILFHVLQLTQTQRHFSQILNAHVPF